MPVPSAVRTLMLAVSFLLFAAAPMAAQATFQDKLLDRMCGAWVLTGTIDGQRTTHDITVDWVLGHQYLQMHEVAREKDSTGAPAYEAIVYIGWDKAKSEYACLWLDVTSTGPFANEGVGRARRDGDTLPFVFSFGNDHRFLTTFLYDRAADTWSWTMDDDQRGTRTPFARVSLVRN